MPPQNARKFSFFDRWRGNGIWRFVATWMNGVSRALNRAHSNSPLCSLTIGPDGGLEHDFDENALLMLTSTGKVKVDESDLLDYLENQLSDLGTVTPAKILSGSDKIIRFDVVQNYDPGGDNSGTSRGANKTFVFRSDSSSFELTLDDTIDYRGRDVLASLDVVPDTIGLTPTGYDLVRVPINPTGDITITTANDYSLFVSASDGSLVVSCSAVKTAHSGAWIKASGPMGAPHTCLTSAWPPTAWPDNALVEQYTLANNYTSPEADAASICYRSDDGASSFFELRIKGSPITLTADYGSVGVSSCFWGINGGGYGTEYRDHNSYPAWADYDQNLVLYLDATNGRWLITPAAGEMGIKAVQGTPVGDWFTTEGGATDGGFGHTNFYCGITVAEAT